MLKLYYCDYFYIFVLLFIFILSLFKNNNYLSFLKLSYLNLFILMSKIMFLYIIVIIISLNFFNTNCDFKLNLFIAFKLIFCFFCLIFLIFLENYSNHLKINNFEYFFTLFFSIFSLSLFLQANNFLSFYILLESYALSICAVFVIKKLDKKLIDASFKYFVFNIISSSFILFGISNIYFSSGLINFNDLDQIFLFYNLFYFKNIFNYGYTLLFLGFLMKLSIFPFSLFLAEIYASLPNLYVFFLLIMPKFVFIIFIFNNVFIFSHYLSPIFLFFITFLLILTSGIHSIMSVHSLNLKNIIINVSFANAPFLVLPLFYKSIFLLNTFFNFVVIYFFNLLCFFIILLLLNNKKIFMRKITSLVSLSSTNFSITFLLAVNLLSMCSLPPFSGFFAKLYFFYFLVEFKLYFFYFFLSIINLVTIYSYLRIIRLFFVKKQNLYLKNLIIKKNFLLFVVCFLTFFNIIFLLFFDTFYSIFLLLLNYNILF